MTDTTKALQTEALPLVMTAEEPIADDSDMEAKIEADVAKANQEAPAQRQVIVIPGQYTFNPEILKTEAGEFVEFGYGTPVHGGQLYFNRSQLVALGSAMLQLAGRMTPPKDVARQERAPESPTGASQGTPEGTVDPMARLVGPAGETLVK